jgi:transcriptional regulator with XRE-family HTH domain
MPQGDESGLAERLRAARRRAALSQHELAALAGVGRQTIARAELGATGLRVSSARKLAEALGVRLGASIDAGWLLTGLEETRATVEAVGAPMRPRPHPGPLPGGDGTRSASRPFALPSARQELAVGSATSTELPDVWRRVVLAPGVELTFRADDDPARARAIGEIVEHARRRLADRKSRSQESPETGLSG